MHFIAYYLAQNRKSGMFGLAVLSYMLLESLAGEFVQNVFKVDVNSGGGS